MALRRVDQRENLDKEKKMQVGLVDKAGEEEAANVGAAQRAIASGRRVSGPDAEVYLDERESDECDDDGRTLI